MLINGQTRVADIMCAVPGSRRLLLKLCPSLEASPDRPLEELCGEMGLSIKEVLRGLECLEPECASQRLGRWADATFTELVEHIESTHHVYTRGELARLEGLLDKAIREEGESRPELAKIRTHFQRLQGDLLVHMAVEERHIFASIKAFEAGRTAPAVLEGLGELFATMRSEHEDAEELLHNIGIESGSYAIPPDAGPSLRALYLGLRDLEDDLFRHIYLENIVLFPRFHDAQQAKAQ